MAKYMIIQEDDGWFYAYRKPFGINCYIVGTAALTQKECKNKLLKQITTKTRNVVEEINTSELVDDTITLANLLFKIYPESKHKN